MVKPGRCVSGLDRYDADPSSQPEGGQEEHHRPNPLEARARLHQLESHSSQSAMDPEGVSPFDTPERLRAPADNRVR